MKESTTNWLRLVDRALRPSAAARRAQVQVDAEHNDALRVHTSEVASFRAEVEDVHRRLDQLQEIVVSIAKAQGAFRASNADYDRWTELIIKESLADGGVGIDIGAHSGHILRSILEASPHARHIAFEPIPELATGLRRDFPSVEVHEVALSTDAGEVEFHHVTSNPSYSGIRRRHYNVPEEVVLLKVHTARLDDLVDSDQPVRLVKLDVEGAELDVLRGAARLLTRHRPVVVFELGLGASDVYGATPADIHDLFASHGMVVGLLDDYLQRRRALTRDELEHQYATSENHYFVAWAPDSPQRD